MQALDADAATSLGSRYVVVGHNLAQGCTIAKMLSGQIRASNEREDVIFVGSEFGGDSEPGFTPPPVTFPHRVVPNSTRLAKIERIVQAQRRWFGYTRPSPAQPQQRGHRSPQRHQQQPPPHKTIVWANPTLSEMFILGGLFGEHVPNTHLVLVVQTLEKVCGIKFVPEWLFIHCAPSLGSYVRTREMYRQRLTLVRSESRSQLPPELSRNIDERRTRYGACETKFCNLSEVEIFFPQLSKVLQELRGRRMSCIRFSSVPGFPPRVEHFCVPFEAFAQRPDERSRRVVIPHPFFSGGHDHSASRISRPPPLDVESPTWASSSSSSSASSVGLSQHSTHAASNFFRSSQFAPHAAYSSATSSTLSPTSAVFFGNRSMAAPQAEAMVSYDDEVFGFRPPRWSSNSRQRRTRSSSSGGSGNFHLAPTPRNLGGGISSGREAGESRSRPAGRRRGTEPLKRCPWCREFSRSIPLYDVDDQCTVCYDRPKSRTFLCGHSICNQCWESIV